MGRSNQGARTAKLRNFPRRAAGWIGRTLAGFLLVSIGATVIFKWVPVPVTLTMILDPNGFDKTWTPLSRIDRDMVAAVIAGEDAKFCTHSGFDAEAIEKAIERNARSSRLRGGSTISQQTAKNAFLWQGRSWLRKSLEVWFTMLIEVLWGKQRIMEVYLNIAETGIGTFGVNAGAQRYFGHDATRLTRTEAARLAAVLPLPKKREAITPSGYTRRYGGNIARRIAIVQRDGLNSCLK